MKRYKKIMMFLFVFLSLVFIFVLPVSANTNKHYNELYSSIEDIENIENNEILEKYGITLENENWIENITSKNIFDIFVDLIKDGYKLPLAAFSSSAAVMLITAAFSSFLSKNEYYINFITIAAAATVLIPLFSTLLGAGETLSVVANFMLSFIPIFIGIVISGGFVTTASVTSPILLFVSSAVAKISTDSFLPLMGGYLSLSICSNVSPVLKIGSLATSIKNAANWIMGICTTIFLGVLSLTSTVSASSDSLALKTTRFVINGVPIVGSAISESLGVTTASAEFLKSSVGIWGVLAVVAILLPSLITLLLWKFSLFLSAFTAEILGINNLSEFFKSINAVVSVTVGIIIFVGMLFVIGLAILVGVKK